MNGKRDKVLQAIVHKSMAGHGAKALELRRRDDNKKMACTVAAARMSHVQVGFIDDLQLARLKAGQAFFDEVCPLSVLAFVAGGFGAHQPCSLSVAAKDLTGALSSPMS